jgi:hypothetical protein
MMHGHKSLKHGDVADTSTPSVKRGL